MEIWFDNDLYIAKQSQAIEERIKKFGSKLYLEFGWKIFDDYHASRVLPWFLPDSKIQMLKNLANKTEIVIAVSALDIEKNRTRQDVGLPYQSEVFRMINMFKKAEFEVNGVVITRYRDNQNVRNFIKKLKNFHITHYIHYEIQNYPYNLEKIISEKWYWKNDYISTKKPLVVITWPGSWSWKMSVALSQLFHDEKNNIKAGYAKFETFPVWNLAISHPVNLAYEAATADLWDVNMVDPFHLEAYNKIAINYNRDIELFPILKEILTKILWSSPYKSPTDMWVNRVGLCFCDEEIIKKSAEKEIIRRYFSEKCNIFLWKENWDTLEKIEKVMIKANISPNSREIISIADKISKEKNTTITIIEIEDKKISWKSSSMMSSAAAAIINTLKYLSDINDSIHIISPVVLETLQNLKIKTDLMKESQLWVEEVLIAIAISATTSPVADIALKQLSKLQNADSHSSAILSNRDIQIFKNLWICISMNPKIDWI